jgi:putative ABC transport system substrate-binding protein
LRAFLTAILVLALLLPLSAQAYDLLVLESRHNAAYDELLDGFASRLQLSRRVITLSTYDDVDIGRIVREDRPRLILTLGDTALAAVRSVRQTPVIALMALGIHARHDDQPNLTGICMYVPPERYLAVFRAVKAHRVGVILDPGKSGWYLQQARDAARRAGVELVVREVSSPREAVERLAGLARKVDALWLLPDTTALTRATAEAYFRFAQEQDLPAVGFASAYLGYGGAVALDIDPFEMGRQAGEMAAGLLAGAGAGEVPVGLPRATRIRYNRSVLKRLAIPAEPLDRLSATGR